MLFLPELFLLGSGLVLFFASLCKTKDETLQRISLILCILTLFGSLAALNQEGTLFYESYKVDFFSQLFKLLMIASTVFIIYFGKTLPGINTSSKAEYYLFLFMSLLGLTMLVSSVELLAIFVALELSSFAVYIMVPMRNKLHSRGKLQSEAGIKYLLFGVMCTGFMLFGMSYIFGLTGSTYLSVIIEKLPAFYGHPAAVVAIVMVMIGFFYKLAIFPFHFWVPDVYEGGSNETTAFIATIPKLAAVALLLRLVTIASAETQVIQNLLLFISIASMFYGNLSALGQKDFKRMLGFSGIAHAGFVLFGLLTFHMSGYANALYYITGYIIMNLACFLVICSVAKNGQNLLITDLKGLNKKSPLLALTLLVGLFSLAGIPPFVGFTAKFMLLVGGLKQQLLIPVILAAINTAIAIYYYLSVVRMAFCSDDEEIAPIKVDVITKSLAVILMLCMLAMGVTPSFFLKQAERAIGLIM